LNQLQFPIPLSPKALGDKSYYCFVEDGLQEVLRRIDEYPCVFDACAFASLEKGGKGREAILLAANASICRLATIPMHRSAKA